MTMIRIHKLQKLSSSGMVMGHYCLAASLAVALIGSLVLSSVPLAEAFQCYVCDSKIDHECTENLPNNFELTPQDCTNITGAKFCIKTTNVYAGELGTKRFCAANDHGNRCNYIRQPTGDREYRSCVLTCDSENCNGSRSLLEQLSIISLATTPLILYATYYLIIFNSII